MNMETAVCWCVEPHCGSSLKQTAAWEGFLGGKEEAVLGSFRIRAALVEARACCALGGDWGMMWGAEPQ